VGGFGPSPTRVVAAPTTRTGRWPIALFPRGPTSQIPRRLAHGFDKNRPMIVWA
jgi:hypothetical protein